MNNIFQNIKGMIIQDDAPPAPIAQAAPQVAVPSAGFAPTSMPVDSNTASVLDTVEVEASINALIVESPSFAQYATFDAMSNSLAAVLPDESTRFKAAQATTKLAKADLIASVDSYKQVLANEQANFQTNFVGAAQFAIQATNDQVVAVAKEIDELTAKLGELADKKNTLAKESVDKVAELSKANIDFSNVVANIDKRYGVISQKLQQYLGA